MKPTRDLVCSPTSNLVTVGLVAGPMTISKSPVLYVYKLFVFFFMLVGATLLLRYFDVAE